MRNAVISVDRNSLPLTSLVGTLGKITLPPARSMSPKSAYKDAMARLVCVALVCWPRPVHMYMLTGLLGASQRLVFHTLSAGTQVVFSDFAGATEVAR